MCFFHVSTFPQLSPSFQFGELGILSSVLGKEAPWEKVDFKNVVKLTGDHCFKKALSHLEEYMMNQSQYLLQK